MQHPLLQVTDLKKHFPISKWAAVYAVDGVSFFIDQGVTVGLVGESGCGKTTVGRAILRLIEPDSGQVIFDGKDVLGLNQKGLGEIRKRMQIIFQDPFSSLDPRKKVAQLIAEPLRIHHFKKKQIRERVLALLEEVGLTTDMTDRYPHEMDGGRCQRVGIARALALGADFIVCDEPVSALDVSIQAQILNLLQDLQQNLKLTYLFISHNLAVVKHISSRVIVMYLGCIMEDAETDELFENPLHPYTQALLSAIPVASLNKRKNRIILTSDVPTPVNPPPGCRFSKRCQRARPECSTDAPPLKDWGNGHLVACFEVQGISGGAKS